MKLRLLLLLVTILSALPAAATHLLGGEMTYSYLDAQGPSNRPYRYRFTTTVYLERGPTSVLPSGRPTISVDFYDNRTRTVVSTVTISRSSLRDIVAPLPPGCFLTPLRAGLAEYTALVELPYAAEGYLATYVETARNLNIANLFNSGNSNMLLSVAIPPAPIVNHAPVFSELAVAVICLNDTSYEANNAYDADGDRLEYSFGTPYANGAYPLGFVTYAAGYSAQQPFGPAGFAALDAQTGLARYRPTQLGSFAVAIDVREYRRINGQEVLLSTVRRDVQLVVQACGSSVAAAPVFSVGSLAVQRFTLEEGQDVGFDIDAELPGQPLTLAVSSALLDGAGPFVADVNGNQGTQVGNSPIGSLKLMGTDRIRGRFSFRATCGTARATPYDVLATAQSSGCGNRSVSTIYRILVTRAAAPAGIDGPAALCAYETSRYTVRGAAPGQQYRWEVQGGQLLGPGTGDAVQVRWDNDAAGRLVVRRVSALGCPSDSVGLRVALRPALRISGPAVYCPGASHALRYTVPAEPGAFYEWTLSVGRIVAGQGTAAVEVDLPGGRPLLLRVLNRARPDCAGELQIGPDPACLAFYNVITPNGDGLNDAFVVTNLEYYAGSTLHVYNRWGRQVYHSADYHNDWTGPAQPAGTYYYQLRLPDGRVFKGWFELLR